MAYNVACYYVQNCLGVGTDTPSGRLEVVPESISGNEGIFVNQLGSHQSTIRFKSAHSVNSDYRIGASILVGSAFEIYSVNANASRLVVTCTGNVGIGTTSPSSKLDVSGADGRIQSRVDSSDGSTINIRPNAGKCGWISYTENAVADRWGIGVKNGDAKLYFASGNVGIDGGTTRMVLDGSGNVGIGTTSPEGNLDVQGGDVTNVSNFRTNGSANRYILSVGNIQNGTTLDFRAHGSCYSETLFGNSMTNASAILGQPSSGAVFAIGNYNTGPMVFGTSNAERIRITSAGCVGIGTSSPSYRLHVNGTFYAAGSSQDYKEGICQYNTDSCLFMCLKPKAYQYKEEWKHLGKDLKSGTQIGLIAEEVAESHPELAVLVNEEDNQVVRNVDYEKLSIILLAEVQKLRQEVDQLNRK